MLLLRPRKLVFKYFSGPCHACLSSPDDLDLEGIQNTGICKKDILLMDKILHDPKDPKLWDLWYIPYYGSCRILSINRIRTIYQT